MTSLVKLYGEFWNPDIVSWGSRGAGNKGELKGTIRKNTQKYTVDFWDSQGIYVLYDSFKVVYVGKAFSTSIGKRLRDHLTDRHAGRWDMFSWYSTCTHKVGDNKLRKTGTRQLSPETVINTLEAIAILIADPALNRKRESLPDAFEAIQVVDPHPHTIRNYLEQILEKLSERDKS